jgi:hypothetical protein
MFRGADGGDRALAAGSAGIGGIGRDRGIDRDGGSAGMGRDGGIGRLAATHPTQGLTYLLCTALI